MVGHRAITLKTQVRRLRYLQVMCAALRKTGLPTEGLEHQTTRWAAEHSRELTDYLSPSGEIRVGSPENPSQSFRFYYAALLRFELAYEQSGSVSNSRLGAVLKHLPKPSVPKPGNSFELTVAEKALFLFVIVDRDADYFIAVLEQLMRQPGGVLNEYLSTFQEVYLNRLQIRLSIDRDERTSGPTRDAFQRAMEWRAPKRYSEDIVPPRLNWLIDLGLVLPERFGTSLPTFHLTKAGMKFCEQLSNATSHIEVPDDWWRNGFARSCEALASTQSIDWSILNVERQTTLFAECIEACHKIFGSALLPRLPAHETFLFSTIYLLISKGVRAEISTLEEWVGYERNLGTTRIGYRKSARRYESYIVVTHG